MYVSKSGLTFHQKNLVDIYFKKQTKYTREMDESSLNSQ